MEKYRAIGGSVFVENGYQPSKVRLTDEEYPRAVSRLVYHCCDVVPWMYDRPTRQINLCLAKRCIKPAKNEWWVYGGSMNPGESLLETARRHFEDDTGLLIGVERLRRLFASSDIQQYLWSDGVGGYSMHVFADTFAFEMTPQELAFAQNHLRASEYYPEKGIVLFNRQKLLGVQAHPGIVRIWDAVNRVFVK
ncbi:MAG: NUDIX domain-containing protein [Patescibacteria group bacterium]